jgi:hypothetical protein
MLQRGTGIEPVAVLQQRRWTRMNWISGGALTSGIVAGVITLVVVFILGAIVPAGTSFGWALGVATVSAFFAGYFGYIGGVRRAV